LHVRVRGGVGYVRYDFTTRCKYNATSTQRIGEYYFDFRFPIVSLPVTFVKREGDCLERARAHVQERPYCRRNAVRLRRADYRASRKPRGVRTAEEKNKTDAIWPKERFARVEPGHVFTRVCALPPMRRVRFSRIFFFFVLRKHRRRQPIIVTTNNNNKIVIKMCILRVND
jgi:hypothetical protein